MSPAGRVVAVVVGLRRLLVFAVLALLAAPVFYAPAGAQTGFPLVYVDVDGSGNYIVVGPEGVVYFGPNATVALAKAAEAANNYTVDIVIAPATYNVTRYGTTPGMYKYGYVMWINASGVHVYAYGARIILNGDAAIVLGDTRLGNAVADVSWYGGIIIGYNASYPTTHGVIVVAQAVAFSVEQAYILGSPYHGIHLIMAASYGRVRDNVLVDIPYQAVTLDGADHVVVSGNMVYNASTCVNLQVNGDIEAYGYDGVPEFNVITGNTCRDVSYGIVLSGGLGNTIVGNSIFVNYTRVAETAGIRIQTFYHRGLDQYWTPHFNTATGNVVYWARYGFILAGYDGGNATHNIVSGNTFYTYYLGVIRYAENNVVGPNAFYAPGGIIQTNATTIFCCLPENLQPV